MWASQRLPWKIYRLGSIAFLTDFEGIRAENIDHKHLRLVRLPNQDRPQWLEALPDNEGYPNYNSGIMGNIGGGISLPGGRSCEGLGEGQFPPRATGAGPGLGDVSVVVMTRKLTRRPWSVHIRLENSRSWMRWPIPGLTRTATWSTGSLLSASAIWCQFGCQECPVLLLELKCTYISSLQFNLGDHVFMMRYIHTGRMV